MLFLPYLSHTNASSTVPRADSSVSNSAIACIRNYYYYRIKGNRYHKLISRFGLGLIDFYSGNQNEKPIRPQNNDCNDQQDDAPWKTNVFNHKKMI